MIDRNLVVRTLLAVVAVLLASVIMAGAFVGVLTAVATPQYHSYIMPRHLASGFQSMRALQPYIVPATMAAGILGAALLGVASVFLVNRTWFSKSALHWKSLLTAVGCLAAFAGLDFLLGSLPSAWDIAPALLDNFLGPDSLSNALPSSFNPTVILSTFIWVISVYFLMSEKGLVGTDPRNPSLKAMTKEGTREIFIGALVATLVISLFSAGVNRHLLEAARLIPETSTSFLGRSVEYSPRGMWIFLWSTVLVLGLPTAAVCGIPVALAPGDSPRGSRALCLVLALVPGIVGATYAVGFSSYCLEQGEMKHATLAAAANLEPAPDDRIMVVSTEHGPAALAYPMKLVGLVGGESPASWPNYKRLVSYLEEREGRWTKHTSVAWQARGATLDHLLYPERGVEERLSTVEATDSLIDAMIAVARLHHMPHSEITKELSRRFLDTSVFWLPNEGGPAPEFLVRLALQADDLPLAQRFWSQMTPEDREAIPQPGGLPWREGRITGSLLSGCGTGGIRIGLYRAPKDPPGEAERPHVVRLLAATETDSGGSFQFTGLSAGEYDLALLLPPRFGSDPSSTETGGALGTHRVSQKSPVATAAPVHVDAPGCADGQR